MTTIWLTLPVVISLLTAVAIFCAKRNKALVDAISGTSALATLVILAATIAVFIAWWFAQRSLKSTTVMGED